MHELSDLPQPRFDQDLPILEQRDELLAALKQHQVLIVAGATGSGKSTQIPQLGLAAGFGVQAMIAHTQPRRIAGMKHAQRVADELHVPLGRQVGFKIRFSDRHRSINVYQFLTDGMLLAETQTDRFLNQYDLIILDEAHERSLNIDFLMGFLNLFCQEDPEIICGHVGDKLRRTICRSLHDGRQRSPRLSKSRAVTFPVEIRYQLIDSDDDGDESVQATAIADAIKEPSLT